MKVSFIFRRRLANYNSIEEVFNTLIPIISKSVKTESIELPKSSSLLGPLVNWLTTINIQSDIIHITGDAHYISLLKKSPVIITIHDLKSILKGSAFKVRLKKLIWITGPLLKAKHVVTVSEGTKSEVLKIMPEIEEKVSVIQNPVSPIFKFNEKIKLNDLPIILHVGTAPHKNLESVIKSLEGQNVELHILGSLTSRQISLLKESRIRYNNFVSLTYPQVYELYNSADIISFPSLYEGFGMPIIEAQAVGRAILTSNIRTLRDVAGEGAFYINPHNIEEIRDGFKTLISNPELRSNLIKKGRHNAKRYDHKYIADQYLSLFRRIVSES